MSEVRNSSKENNIVEPNVPQDVIKIIEKKKQETKPIIIYMQVDEPELSWRGTLERAIIESIKNWVDTYGMPIRRKKLVELVCMDEAVKQRCMEKKEQTLRTIEFMIKEMFEKRKIVKVVDPRKKLAVYYALPEHIEMFKKMKQTKKAG